MPERPDLAYVIPRLSEALVGRTITDVRVTMPVLLRLAVEGTPSELLVGRRIAGVRRHLHFVVFDLDPPDLLLAIHPMLAGRFRFRAAGSRARKDVGLALSLDDGRELRYRDDKQMGKVYVVRAGDTAKIAGFEPAGIDVLDPGAFTVEVLAKLLEKCRVQIKLFLMDKKQLDAFGNAYADEALHRAKIHPKRRGSELTADEVATLHAAIVATLTEATAEVARREPELDEKIRDFVRVRNRKGEPCPECGTPIRAAGVRGHDAFFCPSCQPDPKARGFVDWRKTRR